MLSEFKNLVLGLPKLVKSYSGLLIFTKNLIPAIAFAQQFK